MVRMGYRLALLAALLFALPAAAQVSSRPVKSYPTAPSGSCNLEGEIRIVDDGADIGKQYCCNNAVWAQCNVGGVSDPLYVDSLRASGQPWFDITHSDFGAVCDSSTDDIAALQAAEAAAEAAGGGVIWIPEGASDCRIGSTWTISGSNITVAGPGYIKAKATFTGATPVIEITGTDVTLRDITLDANNFANSRGILVNGATRARIEGIKGLNNQNAFVRIEGAATDTWVVRNQVRGRGYGVLVADPTGASGLFVLDNDFQFTEATQLGDGVEINTPSAGFSRFVISRNRISGYIGNASNAGLGIGMDGASHGLIEGNWIDDVENDGIHIESANHVVIRGNHVSNSGLTGGTTNSACIAAFQSDYITIEGNTLENCLDSRGIIVGSTTHDEIHYGNSVIGNMIEDADKAGIQMVSQYQFVVSNNRVDGADLDAGGFGGITLRDTTTYGCRDGQVIGNTIVDGASPMTAGILHDANTLRVYISGNNLQNVATPYSQSGSVRLVGNQANTGLLYDFNGGQLEVPQSTTEATCDSGKRGWIQQTQTSGVGDYVTECARLSDGTTYAWVPKRVRPPRFIEVSPAGGDYTTVQAAFDAIAAAADSSATNRYRVDVLPGVYDERVTIEPSFVDVYFHEGAVLQFTGTTSGGTLRIGVDSTLTEDVTVSGPGRIVRNVTGVTGSGGGPPEGAVYIGAESSHPSAPQWDRVTIRGLTVEGVHDGIQAFGVNDDATSSPLLDLHYNIVRSPHDAVTFKGALRVQSSYNLVEVDTTGRAPYLTNIADWKSTCWHINAGSGVSGLPWVLGLSDRWVRSFADSCVMRDGTNIGSSGQDRMIGFLLYQSSAADAGVAIRVELLNPSITIEYDRDYSPAKNVALIQIEAADTSEGVTIADGDFVVSGLEGVIRQINTGSSAPSSVYGIEVNVGSTGSAVVRASGSIWGQNLKGSAAAYLARASSGDTIYAEFVSNLGLDTGGGGTLISYPLPPGTGASTYGITIWADGSVAAYDTGTEACAAIGLTCKDAWTPGADSACGTTQTALYLAMCHE